MTPEERASAIAHDEGWYDIDYAQVGPDGDEQRIDTIDRAMLGQLIAAAIRAAINDKLEDVAREIEALGRGTYTTAQTPAGLVRAMKVK